jgi:predicted metal-dependent phosphoesterase TrpH
VSILPITLFLLIGISSLNIDTHLHEIKYSGDSKISMQQIIYKAKCLGLDGICITDHDNNLIRDEIEEYSRDNNFLIIAGTEILTKEGDILTFAKCNISIPDKKLNIYELLDFIDKKNGIAISAHPFRNNNRGLGNIIRDVHSRLSGVEAFNGSTLLHHNLYGLALAKEFGIPCTGGSDAHVIEKVGTFATYFKDNIRDEADFIEAIKSRKFCPARLKDNKYDILNMFE